MCVAFIWVIVGMYAIPCRKELDRLYDLDEDTYMTNIQSEKMDWIMEHKSIPESMLQPIQPFDEYKAELIEEQNKNFKEEQTKKDYYKEQQKTQDLMEAKDN
jgi:hypothetical protein